MANKWEVSGTTATYKNDAGTTLATITGLKSGLTASGGSISGITVTEATSGGTGTINLTGGVLTNTDVTLTLGKGSKYQLDLVDGGYQKVTPTDVTATVNNGTITFNGKLTEGYTLKSATKVTYSVATPADKTVKFVTLSGLNTNLTDSDGKIGYTPEGGDSFVEYVTLNSSTGVVTLKEGALAEGDAKLTINENHSPYTTFALDSGVAAPELGTGSWSDVNRGASTYTADVDTAGYTLSLDSKTVTYTAEGSDVALVTVSGLANSSTIGFKEDSSTSEDALNAKNNRTIVLPASALNQAAVKISSSKANFLLALDSDVSQDSTATNNIWAISGTKAIYKTVTPEYYTYDSSTNQVSYTKQKDITTLATLNGTNKIAGDVTAASVEAALSVGNDGVITVGQDALGTSNLTLVNGKDSNGTASTYKLALKAEDNITAPGVDSSTAKTWAVKGTTATLTGKTTEGWAKSSDTTITYVADGKTVALATVKGLKSGVAANPNKDAVGINSKNSRGETEFTSGLSESSNVITVSANVLGTSDVTLTPAAGYTYSLDIDSSGSTDGGKVPTQAETKHFWYVKGKALLLKNGSARYYTLTDSTTITETDEVVGSDVATVTGLKTGLKVVDGSIDGITVSGKKITVSEDVLNKADVSFVSNTGKYGLYLASDELEPDENGKMWIVDGTTAALMSCVSEGYTPKNSHALLKYSTSDPDETLATVTGLKNGLKVVDDAIDGIELTDSDNDGTVDTIVLSKNVTGTTDITLDSTGITNGYQLALDGTTISALTNDDLTKTWRVGTGKNAGTAYFDVKSTKVGFEEVSTEVDNEDVVYQLAYKKKATVTTTITGLSESIEDDDFTNPDDDGVITLTSNVLGSQNVTLKNATGGTYTLKLSGTTEPQITGTPTWDYDSKTKTTAHLEGVVSEGYKLSEDALSVAYTPATDTTTNPDATSTLATVTGLKSGLTSAELNAGITRNGSVLTLSDSVLGGKKLTVSGGTYTLAIGNTDSTKANDLTEWVTSGTTANYKTYKTGYYTPDAKGTTVKYTAPTKGTTYATVKGIAKDVDINGAYIAKSSASPTKGGTITLTTDILGTSNVTLTGSGFSLELASGVPTSAENKTEWVTSGTTATHKKYNKAYYTKSGNTIKYTKPTGGTTYATIKGIASGATIESSNISTNASGNTVVTLNADQLAKKKVTISGSGYELALGSDVDKAELQGTYWTQAKNATSALYKADYSGGYTAANATTITYSAKPTVTTLATVNGIAKNTGDAIDTRGGNADDGYTYTGSNDASTEIGLAADDTAHTITLSSYNAFDTRSGNDPKNGAKITLKDNAGQGYGLAINGTTITAPAAEADSLTWTINKSKRTATYTEDYDAGVNVSDDKKTLTYAEGTTKTLATISGLDKNKLNNLTDANGDEITWESNEYSPTDDDELAEVFGIQVDDTTIKLLNDNVLGTGKVTLGKNDSFAFNVDAIAPAAGENKWAVSGTTATYSNITDPGYKTTDTKTVAYVKEVVGDPIVTLTGLKKGLKAVNGAISGITFPTAHNITLKSSVLGTTDIELTDNSGEGYKIYKVGGNTPNESKSWTYSGTAATYKNIQTGGYTLDSDDSSSTYRKKITYTAPKTTTLATVKGLVKNFTGDVGDALSVSESTITVSKDIITTGNVTLTLPKNGDPYSLAIGSGIAKQANETTEWVTSGTKANYKTYNQAYYTLDASSSAIIYNKPTAGTTYATISGIKSGVDINSASGVTDGTVGGTITLTAAMLGTSKVTVSVPKTNSSATYTLALAGDVPTSSTKATGWVVEKNNAYYRTEYDKATYALADNAITYTKGASNGTETATIKGATGDLTASFSNNTFSLTSDGLSNSISLATTATQEAGVSDYAFSFNNTYSNSAITGSANADTITVAGDRLTITGGKGNDNIDLGTEDRIGNLVVYANGDGDDTISNFMAGDALQIKSGFNKTTSYTGGNEITVGTGKITLNFYDSTTPDYITINNTQYSTSESEYTSSNVLLADNNYSMDAANLSSLVQADISSYTPYDFTSNFSLTKEDKLTPQISYGGNNK